MYIAIVQSHVLDTQISTVKDAVVNTKINIMVWTLMSLVTGYVVNAYLNNQTWNIERIPHYTSNSIKMSIIVISGIYINKGNGLILQNSSG